MTSDPRQFAKTAADALRAYVGKIESSYWYRPDPDDRSFGNVELSLHDAEEMTKALPIIAQFLETMFEEGGAA